MSDSEESSDYDEVEGGSDDESSLIEEEDDSSDSGEWSDDYPSDLDLGGSLKIVEEESDDNQEDDDELVDGDNGTEDFDEIEADQDGDGDSEDNAESDVKQENEDDQGTKSVDKQLKKKKIKKDKKKKPLKVKQIENTLESKKPSGKLATFDEYEMDSSDEEDLRNTIGNIPIEWYNEYDHLGYDWEGKKIIKPKEGDEVDEFLGKMDDPYYWRTVRDKTTGRKIILTDKDIELIQRIRRGDIPDPNFNPYPEHTDLYSHEKSIHPVVEYNLRKAEFRASISEKRLISKYVRKIKNAKRLGLTKQHKKKADDRYSFHYDLWEKEGDKNDRRHKRHIPAPKLPLPGHEESYNPPPEYLFDEEELKKWNESEPEERKLNFIPQKFERLRHIPGYENFISERFSRCQDLYLCPRMRKNRVHVDPEDLIPKLPKPKDLYPFPCILSLIYTGHTDIVRSVDIESEGQYIVTGSDDSTCRVWEVLTGRCFRQIQFEGPVKCVRWCPMKSKNVILVAVESNVYIINPDVGEKLVSHDTDKFFIETFAKNESSSSTAKKGTDVVEWVNITKESDEESWSKGIRCIIKHKLEVSQVTWHRKGDYFASLTPKGAHKAVVIHQLSKIKSQVPFSKSKGIIQSISFHPTKPFFFVCTQRYVRVYNLMKQMLVKKLYSNSNHISSIAIHPGGDNLILGCFDLRLSWFDLDLSDKPYKTMRYHKKGIRQVAYHSKYPLFASASDDATVIVSHGRVFDDLNQNALIVPVKVLRGHQITSDLGVLDCCFHPKQPWLFSSGADATVRLYTH